MEDFDEKQYVSGFNHGNLIARCEPEFAETLVKGIQGGSSYERGLKAGHQEMVRERD